MEPADPQTAPEPHSRIIPPFLRSVLLVYRMIFPWVVLLMAPGIYLRMRRRGGYQTDFGQRLGYFSEEFQKRVASGGWNWIHSISVGETLVALKLARALRKAHPDIRITLSVTTSTGYALAKSCECEWLLPLYNPLDTRSIVRRVLAVLRPERLILVEGEVWPTLVAECVLRGIPVALADARLSPRSARRFAKFRRWTQPLFDLLDWIAVADEKEMGRWRALGLEAGKLRITGSIKFDHETQPGTSMTASLREVLRAAGLDREFPLFVAGSTHSGEELLLCETLPALRKKSPGLRLVLVPRHVERAGSLLRELSHLNFKIAKRSEVLASAIASPAPEQAPDILLVDTTGELRDWYALATVIFVGKSLCGKGGQNPVEAVLAGKPVVFGPHMDNFQSVVEGLLRARGAVSVANARELESAVGELLTDAGLRDLMSQNAINVIRPHQGASARTAQLVLDTPASISPP